MWNKIIVSILIITNIITATFCFRLNNRLEFYMDECRRYRIELELAENRESEIRANVSRTGEILSQTTNRIGELREKLKAVEDSYNYMWSLFYDDDYNVSDREEQVEEK